ncbi:MAG: GAF domain-containing protein, partial [Chloroflexi bacterium]|nr:GAF domain-containing protein [Chloroflexota bacterium]
VLVYDEQGRYVKIAPTNPSFVYKLPEDMLGKTLAEVLPAPQAEAFLGYIRQVLDTRETLNVEYALPIGGQEIWFSATISPLTADTVFWIARDVSARKRAEAVLAKRATELQTVARVSTAASTVLEARILLQNVVDLTKDSFGLYHAHLYLIDEPTGMLVLAAGAGEVGRRMVSEGRSIPLNRAQSLVARAAREREAVVVNDVRAVPDFLPHPLLPDTRSEMAIPMIVGDQLLGVFDVQHDQPNYFTEEDVRIQTTLAAQVAVALQNANLYAEQAATVTRLRELDHLKSSFLANMSHELRTPLNSILGFTDVMLEELDGPLTDLMGNDLQVIRKNGRHLLNLINDVLDMAKIEAGKLSLIPERFDLQEVLEEVVDITGPLAREKALDLRLETEAFERLDLEADRMRLRQVMINLVNNAIKFTEAGYVTIRAVRSDGWLRVMVSDTGLGIPASQLDTIFQEFHQVDNSTTRKAGGTGLGLPISRHLIQMHGGRLWVESTGVPGEGSTFFIELPVESRIKGAEDN